MSTVQAGLSQANEVIDPNQEDEPNDPALPSTTPTIVEQTSNPVPTIALAATEDVSNRFQNDAGELPTLGNGESTEPSEISVADEAILIASTPLPTPVNLSPSSPSPAMPQVEEANGEIVVIIPDAPPAVQSSYTVLQRGSGRVVQLNDDILLDYVMYSWKSKALVETTADFGGSLNIIIGNGFVPTALEQAIIGQPVGSRILVVFPTNMADLPGYFDSSDGYVLVVDIVG